MNKKYKLSSTAMVIVVIAIVIAFNAFITALTAKLPIKIDMTPNKIYSISDSTKEYLRQYDTPTEIIVLSSEANEDALVKSALEKFASESSLIKVTNIDIESNPTFGQKYVSNGETLNGKYIIVDGGDRFKVFSLNELYSVNPRTGSANALNVEGKITSALKYISSDSERNAYIITGHSEIDATAIISALEGESYTVKKLNLITEDVPDDASLLVDLSPATDYSVPEEAKLDEYFAKGGHAQFYFDVQHSEGLTSLYDYLAKWGIQVNDTVAVECSSSNEYSVGSGRSLMIPEMEPDGITDSMIKYNRVIAYLPYSKVLTRLFEQSNNITVKPLLMTSSSSYETSDYEQLSRTSEQAEALAIGVLATNNLNNASVYVSGTSMLLNFSQEEMSSTYGLANYDYFFNLCSYMCGNTDEYTVSAKSLLSNRISIQPNTAYAIGVVIVILIPLVILCAGIVVWFRRRHL